jgi:hypothetical protein
MATAKKKSSRGRKQDRARVAGGQDYEVRYTAKKTKGARRQREKRRNAITRTGIVPAAATAQNEKDFPHHLRNGTRRAFIEVC